MTITVDAGLQPRQAALYEAIRQRSGPRIIGYGGSRGCSKSEGIRRCALSLAGERTDRVIWIMRRHWDALEKNHVGPIFQQYPELRQYYHSQRRELGIPHPGGRHSSIFFLHADAYKEMLAKTRGPQAHYIFLDQAEEFLQNEIELLDGCNRGAGALPGECKKVLTFNPGGVGNAYLRRIFVQKDYVDNESPNDFTFIQGRAWDNYEWFRGLGTVSETEFYRHWSDEERFNVFIRDTDYGRTLNALPPAQRAGDLMGDFENFSGQYFQGAWEERTAIIDASVMGLLIKPWWPRWLATDWGFSHYAATGWFASGEISPREAMDYLGVRASTPLRVILFYRELVSNRVGEPDLAHLIVEETTEREIREVRYHFMSPDAWQKRGSANTVADQMDPILVSGGLRHMDKADNDRVGGWTLIHNCLAMGRAMRDMSATDVFRHDPSELPALFLSSDCREAIKAIPGRVIDEKNRKDILKVDEREDDVVDMLRYGLKSYLGAADTPADVRREEILGPRPPIGPNGGTSAKITNFMLHERAEDAKNDQDNWLRRKLRR